MPQHNRLTVVRKNLLKTKMKMFLYAVAIASFTCLAERHGAVSAFVTPNNIASQKTHAAQWSSSSLCLSSTPTTSSSVTATSSSSIPPPVVVADANHPLIQLANEIIYTKSGFYSDYDSSMFSEDFVFRGPYIGPLNKKDYLETMDTFGIYNAIPDINPNAFGFSIDPLNSNKVWFMIRNTGTFTGEPGLGLGSAGNFPPNGAKLEGCPETFSMEFDEEKKVKYLTVGYVADRFQGHTGGKGAAVGIFHIAGLPFPSPGPALTFFQWFGTEVFNVGASSYSTENIPEWWKSEEKASEGYL